MEEHWGFRHNASWYVKPGDPRPKRPAMFPDDYGGGAHLVLACTQTGLPSARQRALVKEWCALLPSLSDLRALWLTSRAPQQLFEAACAVPKLEGLFVKWSGIKSLGALTQARSLTALTLGGSPGIESIEPLAGMDGLRVLELGNLKRINELDPLGQLVDLDTLGVNGGRYSTQRVKTLGPLGRLTELRSLSLVNLRADDASLRPLFALRKLRRFRAAYWWPEEEYDELCRLNPGLG